MLRIHEVKVAVGSPKSQLPTAVLKKLGVKGLELGKWTIVRESLDARDKSRIQQVYSIDFEIHRIGEEAAVNPQLEQELLTRCKKVKLGMAPDMSYHYVLKPEELSEAQKQQIQQRLEKKPPVVVGFGPCGMFAALVLAQMGLHPLVLERGMAMEDRTAAVDRFWEHGVLNETGNVQFGEGGAGAFSDGKLTTQIKDVRIQKVLEELVKAGGNEEILYKQKPHIGTDVLRHVVVAVREEIIRLGGTVRFESQVTDLTIENGRIHSLTVNGAEKLECDFAVMALGHSARDTMKTLYARGIEMVQKPFSMGVRIEHPQTVINQAQYGESYARYKEKDGSPSLGAAEYKLSHHCKNGRGVYTFCMCPGGRVIGAASQQEGVVTNGMSYHSRALENANSALLVDVKVEDFHSDHPLAGMDFQRKYEKLAYETGGSSYCAPAQRIGDFLAGRPTSEEAGQANLVRPSYMPGVTWTDVSRCLPDFVAESIKEALPYLGKKLKGFDSDDSVVTAIESRSSSPVRLLRSSSLESSVSGLYPGGEGAGYAGGITSAAVDGIKIAEAIAQHILEEL